MKNLKKIATLIMALAMVLTMNIAAFADDPAWKLSDTTATTSTITVTNLKSGGNQEVTIYKVYTLDAANSQWVLNSDYKDSGLPATVTDTAPTIDGANLMTYFNDKTGAATKTTTAAETTAEFTGNEPGFYFVKVIDKDGVVTYNPMYVNTYDYDETSHLFSVNNATAEAKYGDVPVNKSQDDENQAVYIGQKITYTINGVIKAGQTSYVITDNLSGADYNKDWKLTIGGAEVATAPVVAADGKSFTLTIDNSNNSYDGCQVVLTYTATVNQDAVNGVTNTVTDTNDQEGKTTNDYTATVTVKKTDADDNALSGAQFALKNSENKYAELSKDDNGNVYFTGTWLETQPEVDSTNVVTTGTDGTAAIKGLDIGTYTFVEVKAPEGYTINKDGGTSVVTIKDNKEKAESQADLTVTDSTVKDTKLSELPSTGGRGTMIFTLIGCAVMIFFAVSYMKSKKKNAQ